MVASGSDRRGDSGRRRRRNGGSRVGELASRNKRCAALYPGGRHALLALAKGLANCASVSWGLPGGGGGVVRLVGFEGYEPCEPPLVGCRRHLCAHRRGNRRWRCR